MSMPAWPSFIAHAIQRDSFSFKPVQAFRRTDFDRGAVRQRRTSMSAPVGVSGTIVMDTKEFEYFKGFFHNTLFDGAIWFTLPIMLGEGGCLSNEARFVEPYSAGYLGSTRRRIVSIQIEIRNLSYVADATLWFIETYGEDFALSFTDLLQPIINLESGLPGYPYVTRSI